MNVEKAEAGRQIADEFWDRLMKEFGENTYRISMVINDLQDKYIKYCVEYSRIRRLWNDSEIQGK